MCRPSISRQGMGRSMRPSLMMFRETVEPVWTVAASVRVAEMVTVAPVFTSTGNGWTSAASIVPTEVSAPSGLASLLYIL